MSAFFSAETAYHEDHMKYFRVVIFSHGLAKWHPGGIYRTSCPLDVTYFPFDSQVSQSHVLHFVLRVDGSCYDCWRTKDEHSLKMPDLNLTAKKNQYYFSVWFRFCGLAQLQGSAWNLVAVLTPFCRRHLPGRSLSCPSSLHFGLTNFNHFLCFPFFAFTSSSPTLLPVTSTPRPVAHVELTSCSLLSRVVQLKNSVS